MPRCLMAKKWKQVPYDKHIPLHVPESSGTTKGIYFSTPTLIFNVQVKNETTNPSHRNNKINSKKIASINHDTEEEETMLVSTLDAPPDTTWPPLSPDSLTPTGTSSLSSWLPVPTAGKVTVFFNGYVQELPSVTSNILHDEVIEDKSVTNMDHNSKFLLRSAARSYRFSYSAATKNRDIYRPYCLPECVAAVKQEKLRLQSVRSSIFERKPEDITTAHAILDLSTSSPLLPPTPPSSASVSPVSSNSPDLGESCALTTVSRKESQTLTKAIDEPKCLSTTQGTTLTLDASLNSVTPPHAYSPTSPSDAVYCDKTVSYAYDSFVVSDGRSKKKGSCQDSKSQDEVLPASKYKIESDSDSCLTPDIKARYSCTECGKNYATSSNLSRHKQTHRSLDSQSAKRCPTCGKAYVSMPALAMHILTHSLHHRCDICGKAFSRPWLLQGHMRSHTGEKPYSCACGKAFADRSNLRAHLQTHSSSKNYICKRCNKSFALKSYLNKHNDSACFKDCQSSSFGDSSESSCGCEVQTSNESGESFCTNSNTTPTVELTVEVVSS